MWLDMKQNEVSTSIKQRTLTTAIVMPSASRVMFRNSIVSMCCLLAISSNKVSFPNTGERESYKCLFLRGGSESSDRSRGPFPRFESMFQDAPKSRNSDSKLKMSVQDESIMVEKFINRINQRIRQNHLIQHDHQTDSITTHAAAM
jgi:hypothetical protein